MTWSAQDDGAESNPRVMRLEQGDFMRKALGFGDPYLQRGVAWGFLSLLASWSGKHFTDLHFPEVMVRRVAGPHAEWVVKAWQSAGLVGKKTKGRDGDPGWQVIDNGDQLINVLTKEQVEANKKKHVRNDEEVAARLRDGDLCRYCAKPVQFIKRQGWWRGTYTDDARAAHRDHVDPKGRAVVVVCGECNQEKGEQTPEEWGRRLLPVPDDPPFNADTLELFNKHFTKYGVDWRAERARMLAWYRSGADTDPRTNDAPVSAPAADQGVPVPATTGQGAGPDWTGQVWAGPSDETAPVVRLRPVRDDSPGGAA